MNLLEINVFILRFQSEIWNDVAMKLLFSTQFLSQPDSDLLSFFYRAVTSLIGSKPDQSNFLGVPLLSTRHCQFCPS